MSDRNLRQMTRSRAPKFGHFIVEFASPGIGHIVKAAGCDFAVVDMEHSGFGFETVKSAIRYLEAADLPAIVRVPSKEYHHIARACDMGAEGIMLPMVSSARQAREILDCIKYYPKGKRGVALGIAHDNYRTGPVASKLAAANERTALFCQIETAEGAKNADSIAALDGVDCLWVGHFDLSVSLGIPGQYDHPKFAKAIDKVVAAGAKHKKGLARLVPDVETGIACNKLGFDFICYSGDAWLLQSALAQGVSRLRAACRTK